VSPYVRPSSSDDLSPDDSSSGDPSAAETEILPAITDADLGEEPDLLAEPPLDDDLNERIAKAAPRRMANRATYALAAVALLVIGFVGGAQVQKSYGPAPTGSGGAGGVNPAALASAFAGRNGGGAQGFNGAGQGNAGGTGTTARGGVTGTVKLVDGTTVYVETADGTTVIVKTSDKTTVSTPGALKDLTAGSTVTVQGQSADGSVTATSITKTK
jgi:hypothetical protein